MYAYTVYGSHFGYYSLCNNFPNCTHIHHVKNYNSYFCSCIKRSREHFLHTFALPVPLSKQDGIFDFQGFDGIGEKIKKTDKTILKLSVILTFKMYFDYHL